MAASSATARALHSATPNDSAMTLAARLAALLADHGGKPPVHDGDDRWRERSAAHAVPGVHASEVAAAVLVAFVDRPRPTILLTRRQAHLARHSGQVAFPGGRSDAGDADAIATALREAEEEVGLARHLPHVLGSVAPYRTVTNYVVTPVIAVIPPDSALVADPGEVAALFEVACDHLFDPANQQRRAVDWDGDVRHYWEIIADTPAGSERIWGATAGMIRNLGVQLGLADAPAALNHALAR